MVSLMAKVMVRLPGLVRARGYGRPWIPGARPGRGLTGLPVAELVDHDHVLGAARWPAAGERQVVGVRHLAHVLIARPRIRDEGAVGLAAGSGFAGCPVVTGHWPASLSAASPG